MNTPDTVHFADNYLLNPTNPIWVNLIGAGGTGSKVLSELARMNQALTILGHPGLFVQLIDNDKVAEANRARQLFAQAEVGLYKSVALINRVNRFFGTDWKAQPYRFTKINLPHLAEEGKANLTISCVDTVKSRFDIAKILKGFSQTHHRNLYRPMYWMDYGNSRYTGQVILSTIGKITQPESTNYLPVATLPLITDEFKDLLYTSEKADDTPSCSLEEALTKQDLYINSSLASLGCSLLWQLFSEGLIENRGFFFNIKNFRSQPIPITS